MTDKDKKEIINLFNQGIEEVILPAIEKLASKEDLKQLETVLREDIKDVQSEVESLSRKVEANQLRSDDQEKDIIRIKKQFSVT